MKNLTENKTKMTIEQAQNMKNDINILEYMDIVKELAKKRAAKRIDLQDDFCQEGYLILRNAKEQFKPEKGVPFGFYIRPIVGHTMTKTKSFIDQAFTTSRDEEDDYDTSENERCLNMYCEDYDAYPWRSIDGVEESSRWEICDCENPTPSERFERENTYAAVRYLVNRLPKNERVAVKMHYGFDNLYERPLESIAEELGSTVEGARKTVLRGLNRLREWLTSPQYDLCA